MNIEKRILKIKEDSKEKKNIIYVMIRDLRVYDNWAINYFQLKNFKFLIYHPINKSHINNNQKGIYTSSLYTLDAFCKKLKYDLYINYSDDYINNTIQDIIFFIKKLNINTIFIDHFPLKIYKDLLQKIKEIKIPTSLGIRFCYLSPFHRK